MPKELLFSKDARQKMFNGVEQIANAVRVTLGPCGRNVIIRDQAPDALPRITKDGVTVASTISLKDKVEDMGAQLIKSAAIHTAREAGDGTTTSTVLAHDIIRLGMEQVDAGMNPMNLKKGIDKAVAEVVTQLKSISVKVDGDNKKIKSIATISANNDAELGTLIADAVSRVGINGHITIGDSKDEETTVEITDGLLIDRGYLRPEFINNDKKPIVEYKDVLILIYDKKISTYQEIQTTLNLALTLKKPLLIIADDVDGEAMATMVTNKLQKNTPFVAIKIPGSGEIKDFLEDIAIITGGILVSEEKGIKLESITKEYLGTAKKIIITKTTTTIIGAGGKKSAIEDRVTHIESLMDDAKNDFIKERLRIRKARISNGMGIINVGAPTDIERNEKKYRIDDALCATRAAIEEGVVPGGGAAYIKCIRSIQAVIGEDVAEWAGKNIIIKALESPLLQILFNAGFSEERSEVVLEDIKSHNSDNGYGYNAKTETFEDLYTSGIIDPLKVARAALENAASAATMFLTTECTISDI